VHLEVDAVLAPCLRLRRVANGIPADPNLGACVILLLSWTSPTISCCGKYAQKKIYKKVFLICLAKGRPNHHKVGKYPISKIQFCCQGGCRRMRWRIVPDQHGGKQT
jgi:hypothetical protein